MGVLQKIFGTYSERELKRIYPIQKKVLDLEEKFRGMSDAELKACTPAFKERLAKGETLDDLLPEAFACCREASDRVLGMRHFPVQIIGGIVLHQGRIAEMRTGEGKTLVATLPAYLNALMGKGVHIVTVNDYLARRDSEWMGKVYRFLGLKVGLIVHGLNNDQRRASYNADITYGTNNEFGFDYLRDNMVTYKEQRVQRDHFYTIVDEVDSILIDEARTPLIISGPGEKSTDLYERADKFARSLKCFRIAEKDNKVENDDVDGDYIVDEKQRTVTLTKSGVEKAEAYFGIETLTDPENLTISHHINQAIRAHGIMQRDVDYVVKDDEIIIVDEFTGRLMLGRRYNEGLHQAIEAKEGVQVQKESKTLATITFQNFFRMYDKLSGMTGTASTEADEFMEIYKLDVIEIPTNRPVLRIDHHDVVYKTENAKFNAVIDQIVQCHEKGQPVLVGTISIEKSELLSKMLGRRGVKHEVLNAKFHEKEAEIIAQAGKLGAVTIATNMAGRGTDIMLGGNAEYLAKAELRRKGYEDDVISEATGFADTDNEVIKEARVLFQELMERYKRDIDKEAEKVREAGGLFIIGTERHESRRIDNQLRGRAGRQGDPGETKFFLSLEDDLMRLFGGDRIQSLMNAIGAEDDLPIEAKILTNSIENAQSKVEARNFAIRKNVLQYDDVMNRQREIIYAQRSKVLDGEDVSGVIQKMIEEDVTSTVDQYLADKDDHRNWNIQGLRDHYANWILTLDDLQYTPEELEKVTEAEILDFVLNERAKKIYASRESRFTPQIMREVERVVLLQNVDTKWMQHIDDMEELKRGIGLRGYAQRDPAVEYRIEGFEMFDAMILAIREDTVKMMYSFRLQTNQAPKRQQVAKPTSESGSKEYSGQLSAASQRRSSRGKVGRNDLCPCGSGKKYKKCCGRDEA
ncbi:MAG: preprotein translocase subunit SecA [Oscillospiraceae bacterium]|nr:preprotein translocase subunit SecA [Oscillospiraceae bacterium]MCI9363492.1 preprotein translocase subunit SecA [Oscillospiraceae bacterium]RKJ59097.1 preprotein translocase subunit SecA [bacterium 1XD42-8]RKJ67283.1 preprotein translocase subunit SecA [bacterium 1XD42-1]